MISNRGGFRVAPQIFLFMLLQYKIVDRYLLAALCAAILHCHPEVSFSWIPVASTLCVICPDQATHESIMWAVRSELGVEPLNPTAV